MGRLDRKRLVTVNWLTPKAEVREIGGGRGSGSFALGPIAAGDVVAVFGGRVVDRPSLLTHSSDRQARSIQIDDDLYLLSAFDPEPGDMVNHSCEPNCGMGGPSVVVARRDISTGEELCFDYAMCDGHPGLLFVCECRHPTCRREVTGDDWRRPELQNRYVGFFSPYLARRIRRSMNRT